MPGRVKSHAPLAARAQGGFKKHLLARMASPADSLNLPASQGGPPTLSKEAIIWISILSTIVVATAIIVTILLCRCTCSRKKRAERKYHANGHRHHPSLEITDGRNDHIAWNRSFAPSGPVNRDGRPADGFELAPLSKTGVRQEEEPLQVLPPQPVVVDEEQIDPLTRVHTPPRNKDNRYYSGWGNAWKRVSQIGKAY